MSVDVCRDPITDPERPHLETVGTLLRRLRGSHTLAEVSAVTGLSIAYLSRLERGKRRPRRSTLAVIATAYRKDDPRPMWELLVKAAGPAIADESKWRTHQRHLDHFTRQDFAIAWPDQL